MLIYEDVNCNINSFCIEQYFVERILIIFFTQTDNVTNVRRLMQKVLL